jgi:flagellar biogenesis protein FliO
MHNRWKPVVATVLVLVLVICQTAAASEAAQKLPTDTLDQPGASVNVTTDQFSPGRLLLKMLLGLAAVLVLLFLIGKMVAGRFGLPPGTARYLAVLDTLSLGPGKGLMIVKAGQKYYLLGMGGERISLLTELTIDDLASSLGEASDFAAVLNHAKLVKPGNWQQTVDAIRRQVWHLHRGKHDESNEKGE